MAVKNKIDRWLMPLLFITVLFQNLDKATLSYGSLMGLKTETHLHGSNYSWLGSLVYVGLCDTLTLKTNLFFASRQVWVLIVGDSGRIPPSTAAYREVCGRDRRPLGRSFVLSRCCKPLLSSL